MKQILSPALLTFAAFIVSCANDEEKNAGKEINVKQNEAEADGSKLTGNADHA